MTFQLLTPEYTSVANTDELKKALKVKSNRLPATFLKSKPMEEMRKVARTAEFLMCTAESLLEK